MSDSHPHHEHEHGHEHAHGPGRSQAPTTSAPAAPPEAAEDARAQALADALRSSFKIVRVIMVAAVIAFLAQGVFTVGPQEKALILRLGKPVGEDENTLLGPGLHWAFPYPIDEVVKIPVGEAQVVASSIGWYATTAVQESAGTESPPGPTLNPAFDGYVLTGDANIIHVRGTLRYRIAEPGLRYLFEFAAVTNLVREAFNNAVIYAATGFKVDLALRDSAAFRERVRFRLDDTSARQKIGIVVDQIDVQTRPPRQVEADFARVLESEVRRSKAINEARSYANERTNGAVAEAQAVINAGRNDSARLVEFVSAEAKRFQDLLPTYQRNPGLFKRQRQTEAMQRLLANAQDKIVMPNKGAELRLQLNRELEKPRTAPAPVDQH